MSRARALQVFLRLLVLLCTLKLSALAIVGNPPTTPMSSVDGAVDIRISPSLGIFSVSNLAPGDVRHAAFTVSNMGSLDFLYKLSTSTTNQDGLNLAGQLDAEVRGVGGSCNASTFEASKDTIASASKLDVLASKGVRMLAANDSEDFCFRVSMPSSLGNRYQNAATSATFTVAAGHL